MRHCFSSFIARVASTMGRPADVPRDLRAPGLGYDGRGHRARGIGHRRRAILSPGLCPAHYQQVLRTHGPVVEPCY